MRQPRLRTVVIATGATVALIAGSTTAYAAIAGPIDGSGVIHGCYTNKALNGSHALVLQDTGTTCPGGTTAISWNQQGAAGPAGAAGPQGPTGPAGAAGPEGPKGDTGAQGPAGDTGPAGPAGPVGAPGVPGSPGPAGANGNTILNGTGAPAETLGNDGDFYLDTAADVLYGPKAGGTWPVNRTSLVGNPGTTGPAGPAGPQGLAGPQGPAGTNGNRILNGTGAPPSGLGNDGDFYIDTAADVLYGPKSSGTWPTPGTSLAGPPGAPGTGATVAAEAAGANCVNGGVKVTDGNGNTAYACTGATGPQGPAGTPGGIDSMVGTPCDVNTPYAGTLNVTYAPQDNKTDSVTIACDLTNPDYALNVSIVTPTFNPQAPNPTAAGVSDSPAGRDGGLDCFEQDGNLLANRCTDIFAGGTTVTLTLHVNEGVPASGQDWLGCDSYTTTTCTVTMNGVKNVSVLVNP
jgi:Collagen triple helix repeat (20 copies)